MRTNSGVQSEHRGVVQLICYETVSFHWLIHKEVIGLTNQPVHHHFQMVFECSLIGVANQNTGEWCS